MDGYSYPSTLQLSRIEAVTQNRKTQKADPKKDLGANQIAFVMDMDDG